ncbi:Phosphoenolpyruvate carboxykinase [Phytophthora infestans]|uniref:phosphoenolpyruvate carboxykinase (ATP) n=1 Tax=Phytophthora infestans TaxID=4787 RepID=A0A833WDM6_PHYIN|nr:Phosphoenolpyruvate carboxykinase [Phytophthora infestans]KAF4130647.1 Phosphoenolpyruvate carboxykinase [Phytophthora infestans]
MTPSGEASFQRQFPLRNGGEDDITSYQARQGPALPLRISFCASAQCLKAMKMAQSSPAFSSSFGLRTLANATATYTIDTGKFTGRSPKDKFTVNQAPSSKDIWWGDINQPVGPEVFDELYETVSEHYDQAEKVYVFDGYAGANPASRKKVRFITDLACQRHFVTKMFLRPQAKEKIADFKPDFTTVFVAFNIEKDVAVIGGTWYGGEMKKGIFSMMTYWLPLDGIMAMHCSANKGTNGDTAVFFGLSGTGKTTLLADPHQYLIGDDEHGWEDEGILNFEGGCYAKTISLSAENEPDIYNAIKRDALLENTGGHPSNIEFLTCDAYGVLPPVSKLSDDHAIYPFLSGYTAKVTGTERGVTEPTDTFGAAFLPLHPTKYADLLQKKLQKHNTSVYLVNTDWTSGGYGVGKRMSIKDTRACIDAILDGSIKNSKFSEDPNFGFFVPKKLGEISENVLNTSEAWSEKEAYDVTAKKLAGMFQENFKKYVSTGVTDYSKFGPKL